MQQNFLVGLPGFEPGSRTPEAHSLDQASRQPLNTSLYPLNAAGIFKTLASIQHLSKTNQRAISTRLKRLSREALLQNPLTVERFVYSLSVSNNYKNKLFEAYQYYANANAIPYKKPKKLRVEAFVIHVPTESRIDKIVACCGKVYSVVFSLSKHGLRPDELSKLTLRDLDLENNKLTIPTSKLGNQRTLVLKPQTVAMLKDYILRKGYSDPNSKLFASARKIKATWVKYRKRAYEKFKDPELLKIRLYDLRHWFGTMKYLETHDIFFVQYLLGHKRINNTLIYIHLVKAFGNYDSNFTCKAARTLNEAKSLIESGFEFVTDLEGFKLFRKRR